MHFKRVFSPLAITKGEELYKSIISLKTGLKEEYKAPKLYERRKTLEGIKKAIAKGKFSNGEAI